MNINAEYNTIIRSLVKSNGKGYHKLLKHNSNYRYLLDYIVGNTPLLNDPKYKIATKIYWVLNSIESFEDPLLRCKECGKLISENVNRGPLDGYSIFCSLQCCNKNSWHHNNCKKTSEEKFGKDNYMNRRKTEETSLINFGSKHFMATNEFQRKTLDTLHRKYGLNVNNPMDIPEFVDKIKITKENRYGDPNFVNVEKAKKTNLEKYRVDSYTKTNEYKTRILETNEKKYGCDWFFQSEVFKEKAKNTCLKRYGAEHFAKSDLFKGGKKRCKFDGIYFDSSWEMFFYSELKRLGITNFVYQPKIKFSFYYLNKQHTYHPDFKVNSDLIEIKGDHFFKEDGTMRNPFDSSQNGLYEAKHRCMIQNNVKILTYQLMVKYIKDIETNVNKTTS